MSGLGDLVLTDWMITAAIGFYVIASVVSFETKIVCDELCEGLQLSGSVSAHRFISNNS